MCEHERLELSAGYVLPKGWRRYTTDEDSEEEYFHNEELDETVWDRPPCNCQAQVKAAISDEKEIEPEEEAEKNCVTVEAERNPIDAETKIEEEALEVEGEEGERPVGDAEAEVEVEAEVKVEVDKCIAQEREEVQGPFIENTRPLRTRCKAIENKRHQTSFSETHPPSRNLPNQTGARRP